MNNYMYITKSIFLQKGRVWVGGKYQHSIHVLDFEYQGKFTSDQSKISPPKSGKIWGGICRCGLCYHVYGTFSDIRW